MDVTLNQSIGDVTIKFPLASKAISWYNSGISRNTGTEIDRAGEEISRRSISRGEMGRRTEIILRVCLILALASILHIGSSGPVFAFHSGGVAECDGCHTMHNSMSGMPMSKPSSVVGAAPGNPLLQATDSSSVCLNCHAGIEDLPGGGNPNSSHVMSIGQPIPSERTPGGDFAWLMKSWTWLSNPSDPTSRKYSSGERHGHNVIAADFGYFADTTTPGNVAPGGTYPVGQLHCISCHDPHGKYRQLPGGFFDTTGAPILGSGSYGAEPTVIGATTFAVGSYRLLAGVNYQPSSLANVPAFSQPPMMAAVPPAFNRSEAATDVPVAYGKGSSEWCTNCHTTMHSVVSRGSFTHSIGTPIGDVVANAYNNYVKTGDMSGVGGGFTSLVPVERAALSNSALYNLLSAANVQMNDEVTCFTCHRAHASGWDKILRFPYGTDYMTVADVNGNPVYPDPIAYPAQAMGRTPAEFQAALYDRPASKFAAFQTSLCNKCHTH